MEIQRTRSANATFQPNFLARPTAPTTAASESNPWLGPDLSLANETLRSFWASLAPPQHDQPFFGRFLNDFSSNGAAHTMALGEGDGQARAPVGGNTGDAGAPGKIAPHTMAIGEGEGQPLPLVGGNTGDAGAPGKIGSFTMAIGEGEGQPLPLGGGNLGDAGAPVKPRSFSDAIGEGEGGMPPALVGGNTGDAGAPVPTRPFFDRFVSA